MYQQNVDIELDEYGNGIITFNNPYESTMWRDIVTAGFCTILSSKTVNGVTRATIREVR